MDCTGSLLVSRYLLSAFSYLLKNIIQLIIARWQGRTRGAIGSMSPSPRGCRGRRSDDKESNNNKTNKL